jgi:uncharacterized cupin superfamily protein
MRTPAHWDDAEPQRRERGHIAGSWRDLGEAAGSVTVGLQRIQVDPGMWSTPLHLEGAEEEIFFVLGGSGHAYLWRGGDDNGAYPVGEGDCLVHLALEEAHTLRAGPDGLDVLAFGMRTYADSATYLPRAGVAWLGATWVEAGGEENHPWTREAAAGPPDFEVREERPPTIVNVGDVETQEFTGETVAHVRRDLGTAAGSLRSGVEHVVVAPGMLNWPPHVHSLEEELFVVLDGKGVALLGDEEHPVRPGSVVSRPAATRTAHAFRAGEEGPLTLLAYGTREPGDITYFPRSGKLNFRAFGLIGRIEPLDYWDGER